MLNKLISSKPQAGFRALCSWGWGASKGVKGRLALICLLGVLCVAASLAFVWVSKLLIDAATISTTPDGSIWKLSALLAGCLLADLVLSQVNSYTSSLTTQRMTNRLRHRIYTHMLRSDLYADRRHSGDILNRITVDVGTVVSTIVNTLPQIFVMIVQLGAAIWLLCVMNPMLALCALIITPICILASKAYMMKMRRINAEIRQGESRIHTNLQEGLQHRIVVQTLECEPEMTGRLENLQKEVFTNVIWRTKVSMFSRTTVRLGFIAGYLIAFIWSVFGIHSGVITYGVMTAFLQLVGRIQGPISSLSNTIPSLVSTATSIDRLMELYPMLDAPCMEPRTEKSLEAPIGIKIDNISFSYPDSDVKVFNGFSHTFAPGSKTVIMGETGVGKSTLTKLILAILHPQQGFIDVFSGSKSRAVSPLTRRYMTYVPQGNSLLEGTIRENLQLGNPTASDHQMREALDIAVANFVYDLTDGLDTQCGELGSGLSEGQCQRIAIARALLRDCPVLILDEFNSSLDQSTAATLLQRLIAARPKATIIFISHRQEVVEYCDNVVKLDYNR